MPTPGGRQIGLAHLTVLDSTPSALVECAAEAGYDFVGIRVRPATREEVAYDLRPGSRMLRETQLRLADTGIGVKDVEFLLLDGQDRREDWLPMLEAGRALGASTLTVAVSDRDAGRVHEALARLAEDGRDHGITPTVEPISYQAVRTVPQALEAARASGCDVLLDTLHLARAGCEPADLVAVASHLPMIQLADAPAESPGDRDALIQEARSGRLAPGEGALDVAETVALLGEALASGPRSSAPLPVSIEVPGLSTRGAMDPTAWARRLLKATEKVLCPARPRTQDKDAATAKEPVA